MTEPIFEIIDSGNHYKIYENGEIEGFSEDAIIFNRIAVRIAELEAIILASQKH